MELNHSQRRAAYAPDGPVAIIAGPGTGKTKTLVERIRFLVASGVPPGQILALTFTKKAAQEMAERLQPAYDDSTQVQSNKVPYIATFHALCFDLLTQKLGTAPNFITEPARLALIKKLPKPTAFKGCTTRELSLVISRTKNMAGGLADAQHLAAAYNAALAAQNMCDFDDLLLQTRDLLQNDTLWCQKVQSRFTHILVDEFQDTNALQYQLLQLLRQNDNVFVIGDPQQSIYGFRGASGDIFSRFTQDFTTAQTIVLDTNYRSAGSVVALANAIYPEAPALKSHNPSPGVVCATEVLNEYREADWVLAEIEQSIGGSDFLRAVSNDNRDNHYTLRDFAILYRNRSAARAMQQRIAASGLPFQVVGEGSPYETPAVQALVQLLTNMAHPDRPAVVPGLSTHQIQAIMAKVDSSQSPHALAANVVDAFALTVTADLRQVLANMVRFTSLSQAVRYFDDIAAQDFYDPQADAITLLTIHAAKGLEFERVFLIGAEEGVLPSGRGDEAEEKRLFYVAATRAKQRLDIVYTQRRVGQPAQVSRFVSAMSPQVLPRQTDQNLVKDKKLAQKRQAKRAQTSLF